MHWYGANGPVDFGSESRTLAYCLRGTTDLYVMINAFWEPVRFQIQEGKARDWTRIVDTSQLGRRKQMPAGVLLWQNALKDTRAGATFLLHACGFGGNQCRWNFGICAILSPLLRN